MLHEANGEKRIRDIKVRYQQRQIQGNSDVGTSEKRQHQSFSLLEFRQILVIYW